MLNKKLQQRGRLSPEIYVYIYVTLAENVSDTDPPQFKLAIRSEPIQDDDPDAQSAFSSVANTLRAVSFGVKCLLLTTYANRT